MLGQGVKLMIILKTAQIFLKIKFLSRQEIFLQNKNSVENEPCDQ